MTAKILQFPSPTAEKDPMTETPEQKHARMLQTNIDYAAKQMTPTFYDSRYVYLTHANTYQRTSTIHPDIEGSIVTHVWQIMDEDWRAVTFWVSETGNYHSITQAKTGDLQSVMALAGKEHEAAIQQRKPKGADEIGDALEKGKVRLVEGGHIQGPGPADEDSIPVMLSEPKSTLVVFVPEGCPHESDPDIESIRNMEGVSVVSAPDSDLKVYDAVNQPRHYQANRFGCEAITLLRHCSYEGGNALKYIWRHEDKGRPVEDLEKALVYLRWVIENRYPVIVHEPAVFFGLWNAHVRHRLVMLPDVYRALDYIARGMLTSAEHLIVARLHELTDGTN